MNRDETKRIEESEAMTIYFASIHLDRVVQFIGGGVGLTDYIHRHVEAASKNHAENLVRRQFQANGIGVERVELRPALEQSKRDYVFPENIITEEA